MRLDATVVESNIHHHTDSTLLADGLRVITRLLQAGRDTQYGHEVFLSGGGL